MENSPILTTTSSSTKLNQSAEMSNNQLPYSGRLTFAILSYGKLICDHLRKNGLSTPYLDQIEIQYNIAKASQNGITISYALMSQQCEKYDDDSYQNEKDCENLLRRLLVEKLDKNHQEIILKTITEEQWDKLSKLMFKFIEMCRKLSKSKK